MKEAVLVPDFRQRLCLLQQHDVLCQVPPVWIKRVNQRLLFLSGACFELLLSLNGFVNTGVTLIIDQAVNVVPAGKSPWGVPAPMFFQASAQVVRYTDIEDVAAFVGEDVHVVWHGNRAFREKTVVLPGM